MAGDSLARGAKSTMFSPAKVSQKKWDDIFGTDDPQASEKKSKKIEKPNGKSA